MQMQLAMLMMSILGTTMSEAADRQRLRDAIADMIDKLRDEDEDDNVDDDAGDKLLDKSPVTGDALDNEQDVGSSSCDG